jgi:hypothetical protein
MVEKIGSQERHIMLDLETLGTSSQAVITQIGGCVFQPCAKDWNIGSFQYYIDPQSCLDVGLKMDWSTIQWWLKQSEEARAGFQGTTMSLREALGILKQASWKDMRGVWSHGLTFDLPILEHAFKACDMKVPWHFKAARDTRTLFWLTNPVWPDNPVKHSAKHDAIAQAGAVVDGLRKIGTAVVTEDAGATA